MRFRTSIDQDGTTHPIQSIQPNFSNIGGRILFFSHTNLQIFHGETLASVSYRDGILDHYLRQHVAVIASDFILIGNNATSHRALMI